MFAEMQRVVNIPVTVKTRIGMMILASHVLCDFIENPSCRLPSTYVSATKSLAFRVSPKRESRNPPPFRLWIVLSIEKKDFPQLTIATNGGI